MEITARSLAGFELTLKLPEQMKPKTNISEKQAQELLNTAYQPTIEKICDFLSYAIGTQDFETIQVLEETIRNIANAKIAMQ